MKISKVAVVIRDVNSQWEGLRSSLGLGLEDIGPHMFVIGEIKIPEEMADGYMANLEYLKEELGGRHFTNVLKNVENWGLFEYMPIKDMAKRLPEYELVIPF